MAVRQRLWAVGGRRLALCGICAASEWAHWQQEGRGSVHWLSIVLAMLAACGNAIGNVLQRVASLQQPAGSPFGPRFLARLLRNRAWITGFSALVASFLLQAVALGRGELSVVEPVIALELPLTLFVASFVFPGRLGRNEWINIFVMTAGLAVLVAALNPRGGHPIRVSNLDYLMAGSATAGTIALLVAAGQRGSMMWRAACLGAGAGTCFGFTATMIKETVTRLEHAGLLGMLATWQTYAAMGFGISGVILVQNALHIGPLVAAQPGFTLMDPAVSVFWGVLVFGERTRTGGWVVLAAFGALVIVVSVVQLARSPLLAQVNADVWDERPGLGKTAQVEH
ncbi:MAG: DMT family transporter [Actinomycetia bacterium]|nr:DMT family transporter [Actinomycetes bacterium]